MKRKGNLLLGLLCLLLPLFAAPLQTKADVIFEPENQFYVSHADKCQYHNRSYTPSETEDYYQAPGDPLASGTLTSEDKVLVSWLYRDSTGQDWGFFEQYSPDRSGWLRMEQMELVYDSEAFIDDHWEELDRETSETLSAGTAAAFWSYPGASQSRTGYDSLPEDLEVSALYTDSDGHLWGYCPYYYGDRDFWVCLTDPGAETLPSASQDAENAPAQIPYSAPDGLTADPEPLNGFPTSTLLMILLPVAAVIVVSLLLLRRFRSRKRN